jgi:enoyl-[acyl-carrier-protein] reductase (NADH)
MQRFVQDRLASLSSAVTGEIVYVDCGYNIMEF